MIKLDVYDYCQSCPDFEADTNKHTVYSDVSTSAADTTTTIRCEHRDRCEIHMEYLRKKLEEEQQKSKKKEVKLELNEDDLENLFDASGFFRENGYKDLSKSIFDIANRITNYFEDLKETEAIEND